MPTRFPERRPQTGLNSWHVAGISIGIAAVMLLVALAAAERVKVQAQSKDSPGVTTVISPSDVKR